MFDLLVWVVPVAVLVVGIWRPAGGLLVFVASLPFFGSPPGGPYLTALDVAALAAIATAWRSGPAPVSRLDWPVLAFVAVSAASLLPLAYQPPSWHPSVLLGLVRALPGVESWTVLYTWRALANLLLGCGLYLVIKKSFAGRSLRPLGLALAVGLVPVVALGLAEHAGLIDLGGYRAIGGDIWKTRLHSVLFHSGWLAEFLVLSAPLALATLAAGTKRARQFGALLFGGVLVCILFTEQRGAWLTVAVQLVVLAIYLLRRRGLERRQIRHAALAAVITGVLVAGVVALKPEVVVPVVERVEGGVGDLSGRIDVWKKSVQMWGERPILGWGLGSYSPVFDRERAEEWAASRPVWLTAHNHYLMIAAERGVLGLVAFGLLVWAGVVSLRQGFREEGDGPLLNLGLMLSLVGLLVYGIVQYLFYLKAIEWLVWILLGALALAGTSSRGDRRAFARGAGLICLLALLLVPWRLFAVEQPALRGSRRYGFHFNEWNPPRLFRWTEGRAVLRLAWKGEVLTVWLANGHPRPVENPVEVIIRLDGEMLGELTIQGGWEKHRFMVGSPKKKWLVLSLEAKPTFRPFTEFRMLPEKRSSTDIRELGVAMSWLAWEEPEPDDNSPR